MAVWSRVPNESEETWSSKDGVYLTYDRVSTRLWFPDGSFWVMGCASAGSEQDAGTRYPTLMQDSNGNQILISYNPGKNMLWDNTSARLKVVEDVRASEESGGTYKSYDFTYNTDSIPHLTRIQFYMGLSTYYDFAYLANQNLYSPFSPPVSFDTAHFLSSVTVQTENLTHSFTYDTGGAGELTKVTFPYGGWLRWDYQDATYAGTRLQREVQYRYLAKSSGASETTYTFTAGTLGSTVRPYTLLDDPGGGSQKAWYFTTSGSAWQIGLESAYEERPGAGQTSKRKKEFTWTQDTIGSPYIAAVLSTLDEGQSYQKQSKTEQTLDTHGNVTETKLYDYGNLTTPARTYTNTYIGGTEYASKYIFNRLHTSTLSGGGQQATLVHKQYDGTMVWGVRARGLDDSLTWEHRGNAHEITVNGVTTWVSYYKTGAVYYASSGGRSVYITLASGANYSAPGVVTPNSESHLAETLTYTSFHGLATDTGPNSASSSRSYDEHARPTSATSTQGATATYTYNNSEAWTKTTANGRWTKTYMDGLGRTIKVETGYDTTTVSIAETEYDSCACSPLGKVKRTSLPYAPGGTVYWTTYTYDCLGRTLSVAQPGNSGTTTYVYEGNMVTVTDPAGKWKKYTSDALGNLTQVTELDPGGGSNHETYYTYNLRGQLTGVSMPRGGTTQTRTFNYDLTTGRLSSAVNPENGTTSYAYNSDGTVASKTDAKNQQVQYAYDGFQRVTQIRRHPAAGGNEDLCQQVNFTYDQGTNGWGRLYQASWGGESCTGGAWTHTYGYTASGLVASKTQNGAYYNLTANYTYDNEGKTVSVKYPLFNGPTLTYTYDAMGRPVKLTDNQPDTPVDWVKDVLYNQAGQVTEMKYARDNYGTSHSTETRQYNILQQMTRITVAGVLDQEYRFSDTANNGRITQKKDWVSGEEVSYQYDSLNRLISAETTGTEWGQSFSYDGFGNLLAQTVTKGSAPTLNVNVDPATNRITTSGYSYDSNGNLTAMPSLALSYDVENRVAQTVGSSTKRYVYDPGNLRVWKEGHVYFYGIEGNLLATYGDDWNYDYNVYFGSKQIWQEAAAGPTAHSVNSDRLDSNVKHFPYGEESTTTTQNRTKFATYYRDSSTALDYARNRYYARTIGRFTSVDPLAGSLANPQSLNRYSYSGNDPVNFNDPSGLISKQLQYSLWNLQYMGIIPQDIPASDLWYLESGNSLTSYLQYMYGYDEEQISNWSNWLYDGDAYPSGGGGGGGGGGAAPPTIRDTALGKFFGVIPALKASRCGRVLSELGVNLDALYSLAAHEVRFYDIGPQGESFNVTVGAATGTSSKEKLSSLEYGADAFVLGKPGGGFYPFVALRQSWDGYTILHELLHYGALWKHEDFLTLLGKYGFVHQSPFMNPDEFTQWFAGGCGGTTPQRSQPTRGQR
jgi:RHS repeat-associated protein